MSDSESSCCLDLAGELDDSALRADFEALQSIVHPKAAEKATEKATEKAKEKAAVLQKTPKTPPKHTPQKRQHEQTIMCTGEFDCVCAKCLATPAPPPKQAVPAPPRRHSAASAAAPPPLKPLTPAKYSRQSAASSSDQPPWRAPPPPPLVAPPARPRRQDVAKITGVHGPRGGKNAKWFEGYHRAKRCGDPAILQRFLQDNPRPKRN